MAPQFPPTARHHGLPRRRQRCLIRASTIQRRIALPQPPAHARRHSPHPRLTSESRSAMTAAAPSPTRNTSGEKRRTSCSSAQSPTASRYGRIFGARSPPGPTDAAAAPAFPTIPIRQFAWLAGRPRAMQHNGKAPSRVEQGWLRNSRRPLVITACRATVDNA